MKQLFLTCGFILLMILTGGCSNDDEPGSGNAKAKGEFRIDGKKVSLKYAYFFCENGRNYVFDIYDTDVLKYIKKGMNPEDLDKEYSRVSVCYDSNRTRVDEVEISYKVNWYRETGKLYIETGSPCYNAVNLTYDNGKVEITCESIQLDRYDFDSDYTSGQFTASFSVEGNPEDITYLNDRDEYDVSSRVADVVEITDPKQISFLKSLHSRNRFPSNNNQ